MRKVFYYCKDCKKTVEIKPEIGYICDTCKKGLKTETMSTSNILLRTIPMASSTKMEITYEDVNSNAQRFKK